jgi:hypothetical protein
MQDEGKNSFIDAITILYPSTIGQLEYTERQT